MTSPNTKANKNKSSVSSTGTKIIQQQNNSRITRNKKQTKDVVITNLDSSDEESDGDIIVASTYEPPKYDFLVPLSNVKIKNISDHGRIIDVSPDGNCGYHAIMKGLINLKLIDSPIPMNIFRKEIKDYVIEHRSFFCGCDDEKAQYIDVSGDSVIPFVPKARNRRVVINTNTKDKLFTTLVEKIYRDDVNYNNGIGDTDQWWHSMHVGPIIAKKYDVNIIAYDGYNNTQMKNKKTHMFTRCVVAEEIIYVQQDYWHEPMENRAIHIVGDGQLHFRYFEPTIKRRTPRNGSTIVNV